jgi:peptidoglycan-N-acetylglucosamine deacetylase
MSFALAVAAGLALGAAHWLLPQVWLRLDRRRLAAACRRRRCIAITFDDGPGRQLTPAVSARLEQAGVPATFFLLGINVVGNEDIVHQLMRAGHELGSHGHAHVHHMWSWPWTGLRDTGAGFAGLQQVTGRTVIGGPFRPPYGKLNLLSLLYCWWRRTPIVGWTHDGFDTRTGADKSPTELAAELRASGGGVVLLHDFDRGLADAGAGVLQKLEALLALRHEGFQFVRVRELLAGPRPRRSSRGPALAAAYRTRRKSATFQVQEKPANSIASSGTGK